MDSSLQTRQQRDVAFAVEQQDPVRAAAQVELDDLQFRADLAEHLAEKRIAQEMQRSDVERVLHGPLDVLEVILLHLADGFLQQRRRGGILLQHEAVDDALVERLHRQLLVGLAGQQHLAQRKMLQLAAELQSVDFRHVVVHHHDRVTLEPPVVEYLAVDPRHVQVDDMVVEGVFLAMLVDREEAFRPGRVRLFAGQRGQRARRRVEHAERQQSGPGSGSGWRGNPGCRRRSPRWWGNKKAGFPGSCRRAPRKGDRKFGELARLRTAFDAPAERVHDFAAEG